MDHTWHLPNMFSRGLVFQTQAAHSCRKGTECRTRSPPILWQWGGCIVVSLDMLMLSDWRLFTLMQALKQELGGHHEFLMALVSKPATQRKTHWQHVSGILLGHFPFLSLGVIVRWFLKMVAFCNTFKRYQKTELRLDSDAVAGTTTAQLMDDYTSNKPKIEDRLCFCFLSLIDSNFCPCFCNVFCINSCCQVENASCPLKPAQEIEDVVESARAAVRSLKSRSALSSHDVLGTEFNEDVLF